VLALTLLLVLASQGPSLSSLQEAKRLAGEAERDAAADRLPQAAAALARALELAPGERRWRTTLGAMFIELRRYPEAKRELTRVVEEDPSLPLARYYLASVQKRLGELKPAQENARRAVQLMPPGFGEPSLERLDYSPRVSALHLLAEIIAEGGGDPEPLLQKVLAVEPTHSGAHYLLARTLMSQGRSEEAGAELALFGKTKQAEEQVRLAFNLNRFAGNKEQAQVELRKALAAYPDHPRALYFLGRELLEDGRESEAAELLKRCLTLRPEARPLVEPLLRRIRN